tara:strand:+ start:3491 stop:3628 length:138 start_codon:yes stop_codon:yes gene_type:complete
MEEEEQVEDSNGDDVELDETDSGVGHIRAEVLLFVAFVGGKSLFR